MLVAVSERGSLSAAGRQLGVSQQAISSRMRTLEASVGVALLTRTPRGASLTPTGTLVASWAVDVLSAARRLELGVESIRTNGPRQVDVAASLTIAEYLLPRWLVALRDRQEARAQVPTQVGLIAANSEKVIALVRSGSAALGFIETPDIPSCLRTASVGRDTLQLAVSPGHHWATRGSPVSIDELAQTPLVMREEGSGTRRALEQMFGVVADRIGAPALPRVEYSTTAAVRTAIASGLAPGVLSSLAIADDLALGRLVVVPVADAILERQLTVVWAGHSEPSESVCRELISIANGRA